MNRVALVTGSTSGIGQAIAERLVADGFIVAFHSRVSVEAGKALALAHAQSSYFQADLTEQNGPAELISNVLARYGRLDVLVNNAGISTTIPHGNLMQASADIWRDLYNVNAIAPGLVTTPMTADWTQARQLWKDKAPMGRGAQPAEIADMAAMLVSNTYLTGEILLADGGLNLT